MLNSLEDFAARLESINVQVEEFLFERENERGDSTSTSFVGAQTSIRQVAVIVEALSHEGSELLDASSVFGKTMYSIYETFRPLQSAFVTRRELTALVACRDCMNILLGVVEDLLQLSQDVFSLSNFAGKVSRMLNSLHSTLISELSQIVVRHGESSRTLDLTRLLKDLGFDELHTSFASWAAEAFLASRALAEVEETLRSLSGALSGGRRLADPRRLLDLHEGLLVRDNALYTKAITSLVKEWQSVEGDAIGVCQGLYKVVRKVRSLHCRLVGFLAHGTFPGTVELRSLAESCDEQADDVVGMTACPPVYSAGIRNAMKKSSFFMGVVLLHTEQWVMHCTATRILCVMVIFAAPGIAVGICGYRYKDVEFWINGYLGGFLTFTTIISTWICWSGACCGDCHTSGALCDWRFLLVTIAILSLVWATAVVKGEVCQLFCGGFNLGVILGGVLGLTLRYQKILDGVLDPELAKKEIVWLLMDTTMSGVILGGLTLCWKKPAITAGTSAFGAALITVAILILGNLIGWMHDPGWVELAVFLLLFVTNVVIQFKCTIPSTDFQEQAAASSNDVVWGRPKVSSSARAPSSSRFQPSVSLSPLPRDLSSLPVPSTCGRRET